MASRSAARPLVAALLVVAAPPALAGDVVFWHGNLWRDRTALETLAWRYNARLGTGAPRVRVEHVSFYDFADRVASAIRHGKGPDLFIYPQDRMGGWVRSGDVLQPVGPLVDPALRARFVPATVRALSYQDQLWGLPYNFRVVALFYNRQLVPEPPRTTAELEALGRKLTDRDAGVHAVGYAYANYYYYAALHNAFAPAEDGAAPPALDAPGNAAALRLLLRWKEEFLVPDEQLDQEEVGRLFAEQRIAMAFEGPWLVGILRRLGSNVDWAVTQLPRVTEAQGRPMRPWITVEGLFLSSRTRQRDEAWDFMRWLTEAEQQKHLALEGDELPAHAAVYQDPEIASNPTLKAFSWQAVVGVPMPNVPEMSAFWSPASVALGSVLRGSEAPEAALARAEDRFRAAVAASSVAR